LPQGLQLVCQLCQFTAASWDGLKLHAASENHLSSVQLYQVSQSETTCQSREWLILDFCAF
jgi:hypothetical protein